MTAPPTQRPIFTAPQYFPAPPDRSDAAASWTTMPPRKSNAPSTRKAKKPANESHGKRLLFITGSNPADFKKRGVMTQVRKQAMDSYLKQEKNPNGRLRKQSDDSNSGASRSSIGSEQQDAVDAVIARKDEDALKDDANSEGSQIARRRSSDLHSAASSNTEQRIVTSSHRISRIPTTLDMVLAAAPMVQPMRTNIDLPYMKFAHSAFQSIGNPQESLGKPLDPFRTMYQASHPLVSVEELKFHCSRSFGTLAMGRFWIPTLLKSSHAFLSTLCISATHFDAIHSRPIESVQTIALRQEVIHQIQQNLLNPEMKVDDSNIIALTQLIASEIIAGDETTLSFHERGVAAMVDARGGLEKLGVNGRLASTLSWVSLESAIIRETKPRPIYSDFCASSSTKTYPNTATIPESPIFSPRQEYQTVLRSSRCSTRTLDLLKDIRMMLDLFLHETKHSRQNSQSLKNLYKKITTQYPSAAELQKSNVLTQNDWIYEACRVASVIQATAILKRVPLSEALRYAAQAESESPHVYSSGYSPDPFTSPIDPFRRDSAATGIFISPSSSYAPSTTPTDTNNPFFPTNPPQTNPFCSLPNFFPSPQAPAPSPTTTLLSNLKLAIQNSNISDCWNDMAGVLLWIALVVGAASRKSDKVLKKWFAALAIRCSILLCFEHPEPVHATMGRMGEIVEGLEVGAGGQAQVVKGNGGAAGAKRRRL